MSSQCLGKSKKTGVRCGKKTNNNNGYCNTHQDQAAGSSEVGEPSDAAKDRKSQTPEAAAQKRSSASKGRASDKKAAVPEHASKNPTNDSPEMLQLLKNLNVLHEPRMKHIFSLVGQFAEDNQALNASREAASEAETKCKQLEQQLETLTLHLKNKKDPAVKAINQYIASADDDNLGEGCKKLTKHQDSIKDLPPEGKFMSRDKFAKLLGTLKTTKPGAPHEGQHVFHIISAANGGPDHTHNFLYALGGSFNISIGDRLDGFNCVLAGKEKARQAVRISMEVSRNKTLWHHIEGRKKAKPTLFPQGEHNSLYEKHPNDPDTVAEELYKQGNDLLRSLRHASRELRQQSC